MALQVWLPLNGTFENKGTSGPISFSTTGTITNVEGKTGLCKSFSSASAISNFNYTLDDEFTVAFWVNYSGLPSTSSNDWLFDFASTSNYANAVLAISTYNKYYLTVIVGGKYDASYEHGFSINTWYHVAFSWKNQIGYLYVDGSLVKIYENLSGGTKISSTKFSLAANVVNSTTRFNGKLNDFRLYDHALSTKEIKELSQALILHYELNGSFLSGNVNLVSNGWGGTENWANTGYSTTEIPSSPAGITHSYFNNTTKEFIPIYGSHSYTMSSYVKKKSSSASTCYLSLIPYDVDKKQISFYQIADGFRASSLTTLSQDLVAGDTVIHLTNASGWANPSTYQVSVAIFGYKDSTGYVYPDLVYTRRCYTFGTTTDKSNLDIENNTVTLLSAYSGETIPAGTSICLTGYGSTYYYPTYTSASNAIDWTLLSRTFTPKNVNYLKPARYVRVVGGLSGYSYEAGITLKDNTADSVIYDSSGYCNNGTITGTIGSVVDSPRYNRSTTFNGSSAINAGRGSMVRDEITVSMWAYMDNWNNFTSMRLASCTQNGGWTFFYYQNSIVFYIGTGSSSNTYKYAGNISLSSLSSGWHHFAGTYDGLSVKLYVDGTLNASTTAYTTKTPIFYYSSNVLWVGAEADSNATTPAGNYLVGRISDFRIYATALSADKIKELYDTSAFVDNNQNLLCYEFVEDSSLTSQIDKTGLVKTKGFYEYPNDLVLYDYIEATGAQYISIPKDTATSNISVYIDFCPDTLSHSQPTLMGISGKTFQLYRSSTTNMSIWWRSGGSYSLGSFNASGHNTLTMEFTPSTFSYNYNGTTNSYSNTELYPIVNGGNILLGGYNPGTAVPFYGKIFDIKVTVDGTLVRDMVPCTKNGVAGLWDKINWQFYGNNGTGSFTLGTPVESITSIYSDKILSKQLIEI